MKQHVVLIWAEKEVTMKPGTSGAKTKVNGVPLTGERVLILDLPLLFERNYHKSWLVSKTIVISW